MGIHLADQTWSFLSACLLGAALGMLYDVFRILRIAFPTRPGIVFLEDLLFWIIAALLSFLFLLASSDGVVRVFLLAGELIGGTLYYCTAGRLVMRVARAIIRAVEAVLRFIFRFLVHPVWRLVYAIVSLLLRPVRFLGRILKNLYQRVKFGLKVRRMVLYNHCISYLNRKLAANKPGENGGDGTTDFFAEQTEKRADP